MSAGPLQEREKVAMENPAEWKQAEVVIADAHAEWSEANRAGKAGLSLPAVTATRLREAGLVSDADEPAIGVEGLEARAAARRAAAVREAGNGA